MKDLDMMNPKQAVNSFNEWDPLEEVIVGVVDGATVPTWHVTLQATMPANQREFYLRNGGQPFPKEQVEAASKELEDFVGILEAEGVCVRRPDRLEHARPFATPDWQSRGGMYAAMPRDALLVVGNVPKYHTFGSVGAPRNATKRDTLPSHRLRANRSNQHMST